MPSVTYPHIELRDGVPYLAGTQIKVVEVVLDRLVYHWDADEIRRQHPQLSLGQIYSALAYYHDHQEKVDRDIEERLRRTEAIQASLEDSPRRLELKALGRLP
jgi:uncharacterized protein (DUF433 family)